jgi:PKD repeat protein
LFSFNQKSNRKGGIKMSKIKQHKFVRGTMRNALIVLLCLFVPGIALAQNSAPVANAGPDQYLFLGEAVTLQGSATDPDGDPIMAWQWEVVSAPASSTYSLSPVDASDPMFTTDTVGNYVLTLIAFDGFLWSDPDATVVIVVENQPPTVVISATPVSGAAPLVVEFDGTESVDPEDGELLYDWDFGDMSGATGATVSHEYAEVGIYTARLIVTDDFGNTDLDTIEITVTAPNNPPEASPTATPNSGPAPLTVQFAANTSDPDGDDLTYLWDFGDPDSTDNTSTLSDPAHVYEATGAYVAWLTVSDGINEVTESLTIVVNSSIDLSVKRAAVIYRTPCSSRGKVKLIADIVSSMPQPGDQVAIYFDGIKLFDIPFSSFRQCLINPDTYKYLRPKTIVWINFATNRIIVHRTCLNLSVLDNNNGVDVELMIGADTAVENIMLEQITPRRLRYVRPD